MSRTRFIAMALAGTALAALPANAGGLLGGGAANCLCQVVSGGSPTGATSVNRAARGARQPGVVSRGARGKMSANRSITGNVTSSVNSALAVTVGRSFDRRSGRTSSNAGLAGKVSSDSAALVSVDGVSRSVGLIGKSSTHGSAGKRVGLTVIGLGPNRAQGLAGKVAGAVNPAPSNTHRAGQLANVSVLNSTGTTGRPAVNVAALNGSGGTSGKVANVSVLNKTGTTGRSLANVAVLNGSGGTSGKIVNVAMLNKSNTNGRSLANVAVLNGRHSNGNGDLRLPNGVRIINGVPCGPDGTPLTGAAKATVMAMISSKGGHGGGSGKGPTGGKGPEGSGRGPTGGNGGSGGSGSGSTGGTGSPGAGSGGSQGGQATPTGQRPERVDRTDLWWPQHTEGSYRQGRLEDH